MTKNDLPPNLKEEFNLFVRFLKDNGIYHSFRKYMNDDYTGDMARRYSVFNDVGIFFIISKFGTTRYIISRMFIWDRTTEGYNYWLNLSTSYNFRLDEYKKRKASSKEKVKAH